MNEGEKKIILSNKNTYMKVMGNADGCRHVRGTGQIWGKYANVLYGRPLSPGAGLPYSGAPD